MNAVLTDDEVGILLAAAAHAPSLHNTQPWRFEVHGPVLDILLDDHRALPAADPSGRAARIAIGAAAFNVRVAAAVLGHEADLAANPDPACPEVVARVFLADRKAPVPDLARLYGEVPARHTYRGPLLDHAVPQRVRDQLDAAATGEGAKLHWLDAATVAELGALLRQADDADLRDEDRVHERMRWVGGDRVGDGVPESALGPVPVGSAYVRDLSAGVNVRQRDRAVFERHPAIAVLSTRSEDSDGWVRAGVALQRVLLVATSYDLTASFLDQVLEHPEPRFHVRELIGGRSWPQMVLRIGYPAGPTNHTARVHWRDVLDERF
ncbi:Acg family FMN-binding oxidoreductase [Kribbella sp. NPDC004875]|uniref:Acg family FMN-binding oxidoreductase n=1 Tax=Kribbella sp. NPDC004875 TaxID=3364107 RepID=UPI0036AD98E3